METLLSLAKTMPHIKVLAEMDFFIDASRIMRYLMEAEANPDMESSFWILRETGSDFCFNKEEFEKKNKCCNKKGYAQIRRAMASDEFFLEFYLYKK